MSTAAPPTPFDATDEDALETLCSPRLEAESRGGPLAEGRVDSTGARSSGGRVVPSGSPRSIRAATIRPQAGERLRGRLHLVGRGAVFLGAAVAASVVLQDSVRDGPFARPLLLAGTSAAIMLVASVLMLAGPRINEARLGALATSALVTLASLLGVAHVLIELSFYGIVTPFAPFIMLIGAWPLVDFRSLRTTRIGSLVATGAALTGAHGVLWIEDALGAIRSVELTIGASLGFAMAEILARFARRARADLERARELGSYRLDSELGAGGMGSVWRATHHLLARPTAIKLVRPDTLAAGPDRSSSVIQTFTREARITASLRSANTIELYDFGITDDGTVFIAMELLDGIDLQALVKRFGPQPPARVVAILRQACDSLAEAHERGLVHRDVKPANLMLCRHGRRLDLVKVLDFGIAALVADAAVDARGGLLVGTPSCMPPEVVQGAPVDARSDLYALGCVAFWLLTGQRVFPRRTVPAMFAAHVQDPPVPPSQHVGDVPAALDAIVLRCLEKAPSDRFASADELDAALAALGSIDGWATGETEAFWQQIDGVGAVGRPATTAA
ncbi:MAG: serine/threonine-protein kinase [Acidobacteriota bacterium]